MNYWKRINNSDKNLKARLLKNWSDELRILRKIARGHDYIERKKEIEKEFISKMSAHNKQIIRYTAKEIMTIKY